MRGYNFLYKSVFIAFYKTWKGDIPHWNAAILYPLMIVLNFGIVLTLTGVLDHLNSVVDVKIVGLSFYGMLILLNYFLFIGNKKYKKIASEFNSKDPSRKRVQYITGIIVSVLGYTVPILIIVLLIR